jgi:phosphopentomutase
VNRRAAIIVLDGVGMGAAPDAASYGDAESNTLGNLSEAVGGLNLPNFASAGLGNIAPLRGMPPTARARGAWGRMHPRSAGKDSTTGHWEIAGVHLARAFPTYPGGFPPSVIDAFVARTGRAVIGNRVASGTEIVDTLGAEQERTGAWIVYTSADSVFQVAANEQIIPLAELYAACEGARRMLVPPNDVSRVIARPFTGRHGRYERTANRRDFSLAPPEETLLDALAGANIPCAGVGKVDDLFAGRSISSRHVASNTEGMKLIETWAREAQSGFLFANLVDFDQLYGHRNDSAGFHQALQAFDAFLPTLLSALREDDLLFVTADHGNDPTTESTDHSRESVPLLAFGGRVVPSALGDRETFSDLGATVAAWLGLGFRGRGTSFLPQLVGA